MKEYTPWILSIFFSFSCHQNNKDSQHDMSSYDSSISKTAKITTSSLDALVASPTNFKLLLDNQYVRVLEYTLEPGKKDEWHTHPSKSSYIVSGGQLKVFLENGETILADEEAGTASWMDAVGKHYVENVGKTTVRIILTEVKPVEGLR